MITTTFTAAEQYSQPLLVAYDEGMTFEVKESVATFAATVSIQRLLTDSINPPNDADTGWTTVQQVSTFPASGDTQAGNAWYRLAILAGHWTSGTGVGKMRLFKK